MRAVVLVLVLVGCTTAVQQAPKRQGVSLLPDAQGLAVPQAGKRIDFGRSPKGVIPGLDRELGRSAALDLMNCPAGVVSQRAWGDLILTFTQERFVGWRNGSARAGQTCG